MGGGLESPISATSGYNCPDQGAIEERVQLKGMPTGQTSASRNDRGRLSPPLHAFEQQRATTMNCHGTHRDMPCAASRHLVHRNPPAQSQLPPKKVVKR